MNKTPNYVIESLREHWLREVKHEKIDSQLALYIPTRLGYTENDGVEAVQCFLDSNKKLMLLLGDSRSGKSLFGQ